MLWIVILFKEEETLEESSAEVQKSKFASKQTKHPNVQTYSIGDHRLNFSNHRNILFLWKILIKSFCSVFWTRILKIWWWVPWYLGRRSDINDKWTILFNLASSPIYPRSTMFENRVNSLILAQHTSRCRGECTQRFGKVLKNSDSSF